MFTNHSKFVLETTLQNKQIKIPTLLQLGRNSGICENELRQTIVSLIDDGTIFVEDKTTIKIQNK
jgi:hypothetical protein